MFSSTSFSLPSQPLERSVCQRFGAKEEVSSRDVFVEILEQPVSIGARFRYKCEGRSAGCIRGINSTDKQKTYPTIKVHGYEGVASVVVSCVTKEGPPYYPHPHNLVGKTCANGVCYKSINSTDMVCNFANLGIQCVKKKDIKESLSHRESIRVDPFGTGFSHHLEPGKINLNCLRLCFQVFLPSQNGKMCVPVPPVVSNTIYDNKTISDLTISKLSHSSAVAMGGQEVILLCDQVNKDDIQILFYEERNSKMIWQANGKFAPHHVHRKAAISFLTPPYRDLAISESVSCFIQLKRPSDGAVGKPRSFFFLPLKQDPDGIARKRNKFEALGLNLQSNNLLHENICAIPRVIRQASRLKVNHQEGQGLDFSSNIVCDSRCQPFQKLPVCSSQNEGCTNKSIETCPKLEDILAIAKDQVGLCNTSLFSDENLYKSLDFGVDPCDIDVNFNLDSFSSTSGLNFSTSLM